MVYNFDYAYFDVKDGNKLTLEERIKEALDMLQNENDCIILEKEKKCSNEQELRDALKEGGIL